MRGRAGEEESRGAAGEAGLWGTKQTNKHTHNGQVSAQAGLLATLHAMTEWWGIFWHLRSYASQACACDRVGMACVPSHTLAPHHRRSAGAIGRSRPCARPTRTSQP